MIQKFLFIGIFACLLSCGFSTVGGDPTQGPKCQGTLKEHPDLLKMYISLTCSYDSTCSSYLSFHWIIHTDSTRPCYAGYEYKYVSNKETKKIHEYDKFYNILDSDEHVRFSLFDKNNVEKSYDIDLSEIIHSYTFKDDSVEIKMPNEGETEIWIQCPYCSFDKKDAYDSLCHGYFSCQYRSSEFNSVIIGTDSTWDKSFSFHQYLSNQSSFKTDSIHISGEITFRE